MARKGISRDQVERLEYILGEVQDGKFSDVSKKILKQDQDLLNAFEEAVIEDWQSIAGVSYSEAKQGVKVSRPLMTQIRNYRSILDFLVANTNNPTLLALDLAVVNIKARSDVRKAQLDQYTGVERDFYEKRENYEYNLAGKLEGVKKLYEQSDQSQSDQSRELFDRFMGFSEYANMCAQLVGDVEEVNQRIRKNRSSFTKAKIDAVFLTDGQLVAARQAVEGSIRDAVGDLAISNDKIPSLVDQMIASNVQNVGRIKSYGFSEPVEKEKLAEVEKNFARRLEILGRYFLAAERYPASQAAVAAVKGGDVVAAAASAAELGSMAAADPKLARRLYRGGEVVSERMQAIKSLRSAIDGLDEGALLNDLDLSEFNRLFPIDKDNTKDFRNLDKLDTGLSDAFLDDLERQVKDRELVSGAINGGVSGGSIKSARKGAGAGAAEAGAAGGRSGLSPESSAAPPDSESDDSLLPTTPSGSESEHSSDSTASKAVGGEHEDVRGSGDGGIPEEDQGDSRSVVAAGGRDRASSVSSDSSDLSSSSSSSLSSSSSSELSSSSDLEGVEVSDLTVDQLLHAMPDTRDMRHKNLKYGISDVGYFSDKTEGLELRDSIRGSLEKYGASGAFKADLVRHKSGGKDDTFTVRVEPVKQTEHDSHVEREKRRSHRKDVDNGGRGGRDR